MKTAHLFAGMGGSHLASRLLEDDGSRWESIITVEIDKYCQRVLRAHFPGERLHDDVTTLSGVGLGAELVIMGFPCTDLSVAGKSAGIVDGSASSLFFHGLRVAVEAEAPLLFIENVFGFLNNKGGSSFETALRALQQQGYGDVAWMTNRASDVGAPHQRTRVWLLCRWTGGTVRGAWQRPARWGTAGRVVGDDLAIYQDQLPSQNAMLWPTPIASTFRGVGGLGSPSHLAHIRQRYLNATIQEHEQKSGKVSAAWCAALMGWPLGWTAGEQGAWPAREGMWPVPPDGRPQHPWEPQRLAPKFVREPSWAREMKALGNAWVPAQAAAAWRELIRGDVRGQMSLL